MNSLALWANGWVRAKVVGYHVTVSAESAPWYFAIAGCFLAVAVAVAGYWVVQRRTLSATAHRVAFYVLAGCACGGWSAVWIARHSGSTAVVPFGYVADFVAYLPWIWTAGLGVLLVAGFFQASAERQRYILRGLAGAAIGYGLLCILANLEDRPFYTIRSLATGETDIYAIMRHPADEWVWWAIMVVFLGGGAAVSVLTAKPFRVQNPPSPPATDQTNTPPTAASA